MMVALLIRLIDVYSIVIIASAILSWIPMQRDNVIVRGLRAFTEPVYSLIHRVIDPSKTGGIDFSPLIVLGVLSALRRAITGAT